MTSINPGNEDARQHVKSLLASLGHAPRAKQNPPYPWVWVIDVAGDIHVGIAPSPVGNLLQVDMGLNFDAEEWRGLNKNLGPRGVAELIGKMKLMLLNDHLEYRFESDGGGVRRIVVVDTIPHSALDAMRLHESIRKIKDSYFKLLVTMQIASAGSATSKEPKRITEIGGTDVSGVSANILPVERATIEILDAVRQSGQTYDELMVDLVRVYRQAGEKS